METSALFQKLMFKIFLLLDSILESIFIYYGFIMKHVEIQVQIEHQPIELIMKKLNRQMCMTWTVFISYIVIKTFDILIFVVGLRESF